MALATSNLHLSDILATLGVSSPKAIFYNGSTLKTVTELGNLVSKAGLDPNYCPGADADARLSNLLADRRLSYFKGYSPIEYCYYYGQLSENWSITYNQDDVFALNKETDHLAISVADSSYYIGKEAKIQSSVPYSGADGRKLYVEYEVEDLTNGIITFMKCTLGEYFTSFPWGSDNSALINEISFATDGLRERESTGATNNSTLYPTISLQAYDYPDFVIKIYAIYYS